MGAPVCTISRFRETAGAGSPPASWEIRTLRTQLEDLYIEEAWVLTPGGERRDVDLDAIQIVTENSTDVFSDNVRVVLPFEGIVPGATAVFVTRLVERLADWPLPSSEIVHPQGWAPLERFELEARWDKGLPARTLFTDAEFLECDRDPHSWTCSAMHVEPVRSRSDRTIWLDVFRQVVVGEPHSWADLIEAGRALVARSVSSGRFLREPVRRLIAGAEDPAERLSRLHRFVADEIRYVGMEHGAAAVAPAPVERTYELRYGDCKGKVASFLAMAEHAGIRAYPVFTSTSRNGLEKLGAPSWHYFDHMIACAAIEGAEGPVCLDLTSPDTDTGVLPTGLHGSVALGGLHRTYRRLPGRVEIETRFVLRQQTIASEDLARYRDFVDAVLAQTQAWFRFAGAAVSGETP